MDEWCWRRAQYVCVTCCFMYSVDRFSRSPPHDALPYRHQAHRFAGLVPIPWYDWRAATATSPLSPLPDPPASLAEKQERGRLAAVRLYLRRAFAEEGLDLDDYAPPAPLLLRGKKSAAPAAAAPQVIVMEHGAPAAPVKKRRGRPPKAEAAATTTTAAAAAAAAPRRGRKKKEEEQQPEEGK
jgi:hypothetical protein